jgi:FMN phosphatase YigB (HAD superfamily)
MGSNWQADYYLKRLALCLDKYTIISFDVFNTIVFRACHEPSDVFAMVGQALASSFADWPYTSETYKSLRVDAEQRARSRHVAGEDCTFDEIFAEMPFAPDIIGFMKKAEIDCEKQVLYLNENMYCFMQHCVALGKTIVLVSDMYHSRAQIEEFLLSTGVDTTLIKKIYVSSEHGCFKQSGQLFDKLRSDYQHIEPEEILHIGDSTRADIEGANKAGIQGFLYPVAEDEFGSLFSLERNVYGVRLGELTSLRKLASKSNAEKDEAEQFFYEFGAKVIGPLYALFADWIISYATKCGISTILSFMREGALLTKVIARAAQAAELNVYVAPIYVSRQPAFMASIFADNYEERISQTLLRGGRALKSVFHDLGLNIEASPFGEMESTTLTVMKSENGIQELECYLLSNETKELVLSAAKHQREFLIQYIDTYTKGNPVITIDVGIKGTTERYLNDIKTYGSWTQRFCHILMMGSTDTNTKNINDGMDILAWLGIAGENGKIIGKLKYQIIVIETFINDFCGSVLGYERDGDELHPVLGNEIFSQEQKDLVSACWNGVEAFQKLWLSLVVKKPKLRLELMKRKADFLNIWLRFIEMPTKDEAVFMGGFPYMDEFNEQYSKPLIDHLPDSSLSDKELCLFITDELKNGAYWPQAAATIKHPEYTVSRLIENLNDIALERIYKILQKIRYKGYTNGVIFCASELGRQCSEMAAALKIPLLCFVDSDKRLQGTSINNLKVRALDSIVGEADCFIIATYIYAKEIRGILEEKCSSLSRKPKIYDFGGGE